MLHSKSSLQPAAPSPACHSYHPVDFLHCTYLNMYTCFVYMIIV